MKCKLCHHEKTLIKKSHIIPDFMYKGLFDEKHKIFSVRLSSIENPKILFSAPYDEKILCSDCDNKIIGKYETYASNILYGGKFKKSEETKSSKQIGIDGMESLFIENISYHKFKLFILSILWRASISKHPFFESVSLGEYEETIRKMILNGNAGSEKKFQTSIFLTGGNHKLITETVMSSPKIVDSVFINYAAFCISKNTLCGVL